MKTTLTNNNTNIIGETIVNSDRQPPCTYLTNTRKINMGNVVKHNTGSQRHSCPTSAKSYKLQENGADWFGDTLQLREGWHTGDTVSTIRICSTNINGISREMQWLEWETLLKDMYRLQINVLGLSNPTSTSITRLCFYNSKK
jgi:hypothetical protein